MDLRGINSYWQEMTPQDITAGKHRDFVGGFWDEIGRLQFDFMVAHGLRPDDRLLDVGCGCLRGGIHFARYLNDGGYHGIDINQSLLDAGIVELRKAGLADRKVSLLRTDTFDATPFGVTFDFGISVSLVTHLYANHIIYCFLQMRRVMRRASSFYFSFFEAPRLLENDFVQPRGGVVTHLLGDPFHYTRDQMACFARIAGLRLKYIGDWRHPRNQQMAELRVK